MTLLSPIDLGPLRLPNRVWMAPLTRSRHPEGVPTALAPTYYAQRASAGLIVAEATQVTPRGQGYPDTPGIHTDAQVAGWRAVTDLVHAAGGHVVLQLWHVGRVSHSAYHGGALPFAPSAIAIEGKQAMLPDFSMVDFETPHAMTEAEIADTVTAYRDGARARKPPASTASRSMRPMATSSSSSSRPVPTAAQTTTAGRSPTASASSTR